MAQYITFENWYNGATGLLTRADRENPAIVEIPDGVEPNPRWLPYHPQTLATFQTQRAKLPASTAPAAAAPTPDTKNRDKAKPPKPPKAPVGTEPLPLETVQAEQPRAADQEVI